MANPNRSQIHFDRAITDVSIAYMQDTRNFIGDRLFPSLDVKKQSNKFFTYDKGDTLRVHTQKRAAGTESAGRDYNLASDNYFCDPYALHEMVTDQDRENADEPLNLDVDAGQILMQDILMKKESDILSKAFATGVWSADVTPGTLWSAAGSAPIVDIKAQILNMVGSTGVSPLDMTFTASPDLWNILENHEEILDRIKYVQKGTVTQDLVASLLGIKEVLVPLGVINTAQKGLAATTQFMAKAKSALLTYAPSSPSLKKPSAGYTFKWSGMNAAGSVASYKFYMQELRADRIEVEAAWDHKIVSTDCGIFFEDAIA